MKETLVFRIIKIWLDEKKKMRNFFVIPIDINERRMLQMFDKDQQENSGNRDLVLQKNTTNDMGGICAQ